MKKSKKSIARILEMPLADLGIRYLTNWTTRYQRAREPLVAHIRRQKPGISDEELEAELKRDYAHIIKSENPQTVGQLIERHRYRFTGRWIENGERKTLGIGPHAVAAIKEKIIQLGLTPADWPALLGDNLIEGLPKELVGAIPLTAIMQPVVEKFHFPLFIGADGSRDIYSYTISDLLKVDIANILAEPIDYKDERTLFAVHHRIRLTNTYTKLAAKGFTPNDGVFMEWNPAGRVLAKAENRLARYNLPEEWRKVFAQILIKERLIA